MIFALAVTVAGSLLALPQTAFAGKDRTFTVGEVVPTGGGLFAQILQCRGAGDNEECQIQYYRGTVLESTPQWEYASNLRLAEDRVIAYDKQQAAAKAGATPAEQAQAQFTDVAGCTFAPPSATGTNTSRPSAQLFKRKIFDMYNVVVDGTLSAPLRIGVTFLRFQLGKPFVNVVRVDKTSGAYRLNDAAPVNATIYPVASRHVVCEQYSGRTYQREITNNYACFKSKSGNWVCAADGVPKITQLA